MQIRHTLHKKTEYNECHHLFAFPSVCSTYSLNSFFFSTYNVIPVFIYSAFLYYVKWCLLIHACTPLIHSLCTLWIWPKFIASLVCLLSFFKILLILTPHIRDLTCLCSCDEKRCKFIFFLKQSRTCCIYISAVAKWVLVQMRKSQLYTGEEMKMVCWNRSLYFSQALFTAKTGFHFSKWKPFLFFFWGILVWTGITMTKASDMFL